MIGVRHYGINMLRKLSVISASVIMCSCGILPGMQNLDSGKIQVVGVPERVEVHPVMIPITPSLIARQRASTYYYRVAPSDVLHVNVWEHPEFNILSTPSALATTTPGAQGAAGQAGYLVNASGRIYFPLVGYIHVAGKTVDQIRADITAGLKKYIPNPQVNVRVADYRGQKIYVIGEVKQPGFLPLNDQVLTVADALALTGGMDPNSADPRHIFVIRGTFARPEIFWLNAVTPDKFLLAENFSLYPKDILYVSSAPATRWNRALNQLLPTIQTVWYTKSVVRSS